MYNNFSASRIIQKRDNQLKAEQERAELENQKLTAMKNKESEGNKKIYLIAGAVAVLGAVIIIIKTRKR